MSVQSDCDYLVKRAKDLVNEDPWAAKAWLITARTLYPSDFNIQYEMYIIERNAERTASAGRLLYDIFVNFPDQPVVWREISVITAALRSDCQDKETDFLRDLFETLPGRVQCEMLLKATEQCFNTLEKAEMLLLLLRRFPDSVVQHGVSLGETLLEAENIEDQETPVNCFRKLFAEGIVSLAQNSVHYLYLLDKESNRHHTYQVCDVLPLIINNLEMCLPSNLLLKYLHKSAEFYIAYVSKAAVAESQHQGPQDSGNLKSPNKRSSQKYIIEGLTEKSSQILDPWERLLEILIIVGARCEWQMDKGKRGFADILSRMKDLCRYINNFENEAHLKYRNQVVYSTMLVFFKHALQYVNMVQGSLFQGSNTPNQAPWILVEDLSNVYGDVDTERNKHIHKKRKLGDGREKPMSSDDEECSIKLRGRHILVNKTEFPDSAEMLECFRIARESWELLHTQDALENEFKRICLSWKTDSWLWLRIFLTDMIIYQGHYRKAIASLHQLTAILSTHQQSPCQGSLEQHRPLIQLASCHFALGEYRLTCENLLDLMCYVVPSVQDDVGKVPVETPKPKQKIRKGRDLKLLCCSSKAVMPYCLQMMLACFKLRAFTDNRDDLALGHVIVLLQLEWPRGENLFLKAVEKICQQGNFQYENFFNYVTNIDMLEEFAYLRTAEGGKVHLELLPNQGMLIKHHTVTRGITKGVKEDFRLAMERQVSRCEENLLAVLHRFCINEKIILIQTLV
ncbi:integrator complex subunit 10 isoform X3 [Polypterus senegalus]|uniref:integrator complex subunit 10 isoform X3 n=1 Tax=Polypterus senegalus TaxID=55291 RepID=UPI0019625396|nr:integrator complex subunit 10 isoform X3 [Polypterus senegalus]